MKNFIQKNPIVSAIAAVVIIVIIVVAIRWSSRGTSAPAAPGVSIVATSTVSTSTPAVSAASVSTFAYSVITATSTYRQDQQIDITVAILNMTGMPQTLTFKNGCQGDYTIGNFDMIDHTVCLPGPTSVTIAPHGIRQLMVTHYPSVYVLPVGTYTLTGSIIGYGGATVPITIIPALSASTSSAPVVTAIAASSSPLILSLTTDKTQYSQTDVIQIRLTAYNSGNQTITRSLGGCDPYYTIAGFNSLTAGPCPAIIYNQKIPPGASYGWNLTFNPAFPTNYTIPKGVQKLTVYLSNQESTSTYITIN